MSSVKRSKRPRKLDGSIDWKAYDKILMNRWKDHLTVKTKREKGNIIIEVFQKVPKRSVGGCKGALPWK